MIFPLASKLMIILFIYFSLTPVGSTSRMKSLDKIKRKMNLNRGSNKHSFLDNSDTDDKLRMGNISEVRFMKRRKTIDFAVHSIFFVANVVGARLWFSSCGKPYRSALSQVLKSRILDSNTVDTEKLSLNKLLEDIMGEVGDGGCNISGIYVPLKYMASARATILLLSAIIFQLLYILGKRWSVQFRAFCNFSTAQKNLRLNSDSVLVYPIKHFGEACICPLKQDDLTKKNDSTNEDGLFDLKSANNTNDQPEIPLEHSKFFIYQGRKFIVKSSLKTLANVSNCPVHVEMVKFPVDLPMLDYIKAEGLSNEEAFKRTVYFGKNSLKTPTPSVMRNFFDIVLGPYSIFHLFSEMLGALEQHWGHTLAAIGSNIMSEWAAAYETQASAKLLSADQAARGGIEIWVYRGENWKKMPSEDLLPGDIVSLSPGEGGLIELPADMVLLRGSALVDEATLTGESIPQMKSSLLSVIFDDEEKLDMIYAHRTHVLYAGTTLLQTTVGKDEIFPKESGLLKNYALAPNKGCLSYVLRTGFYSSQGEMLRLTEGGQLRSGGSKNTAIVLSLLSSVGFVCVLKLLVIRWLSGTSEGYKKDSGFRLLVQCARLLTAAIPAHVPVEVLHCVGGGARQLLRQTGVACTEPHRIPNAARVDVVLFDKTGTLTAEELYARSLVMPAAHDNNTTVVTAELPFFDKGPASTSAMNDSISIVSDILPPSEAQLASIVMAGCHSLMSMNGTLVGDPLEISALKGIGWSFDATTNEAISGIQGEDSRLHIWNRYEFTSQLQRMSTIAAVYCHGKAKGVWALTKGSPEAIFPLLDPNSAPVWYTSKHRQMSKDGKRVLALAYRPLVTLDDLCVEIEDLRTQMRQLKRSECEAPNSLIFAGFIEFDCKVRVDSADVVWKLRNEAQAHVAMITGDSVLTGAYVAKQVGILGNPKIQGKLLNLKDSSSNQIKNSKQRSPLLLDSFLKNKYFSWSSLYPGEENHVKLVKVSKLNRLASKYDLCVTGPVLENVAESVGWDSSCMKSLLKCVRVFARMLPGQKERVVVALKDAGSCVLMCGDGSNDVGALKQADAGVALLSGFGDANTSNEEHDEKSASNSENRSALVHKLMDAEVQRLQKELGTPLGEKPSLSLQLKAARLVWVAESRNARKKKGSFAAGALAEKKEGKVVKTGEASMAAPFTSRSASTCAVIDVIKQGRYTAAVIMQTYQMAALDSLSRCVSLLTMYSDGVRYAPSQIMTLSVLYTLVYGGTHAAKPLHDRPLSKAQPPNSILHPSIWVSVLGQFVIQTGCALWAVRAAKGVGGGAVSSIRGDFTPNLVTNVVLLMSMAEQAAVILANYKGAPFMTPLSEVPSLFGAIALLFGGGIFIVLEVYPPLNGLLGMAKFPSNTFKGVILGTMSMCVALSVLWDRAVVAIFDSELAGEQRSEPFLSEKSRKMLTKFAIIGAVLGFKMLSSNSSKQPS